MMCSYNTKVIGGKLCMFDTKGKRWVIADASMVFRAGKAFCQRGNFPPIKFS